MGLIRKLYIERSLISSLCPGVNFESWVKFLGPLCSSSQTLREFQDYKIGYAHV